MTSFLIGPTSEGLRLDKKPWATPEDSFTELTNAIQWRGRVVRREGYTLLARLATSPGVFNGTPVMGLVTQEKFGLGLQSLIGFDTTTSYVWDGTNFGPLPSVMPVVWSGTNYQFFNYTNYAGALWVTNSKPGLNGVAILSITQGATPTVTTKTNHGFTTGQTVVFVNVGGMNQINGLSSVITVTGLTTFTITINTTAFNPYTTNGIALNSYVTSLNQDGIRYYGTLNNGNGWANYNPPLDANTALAGALLIFPYRGYLVFLNTTEGNEQGIFNFGNRARWIQLGTPYYSLPVPQIPNIADVDVNAARDDLFGKGGANDAPTSEVIIGAGFIRDILVVYFERSTWRLRFVNNAQNPFVWERINVELGSSCTGSSVVFDKGLMSISNRGISISDGNGTARFDDKIPDTIFEIRQANNGLQRVQGVRKFQKKFCYWTYPSSDNPNGIFPDKVLVFNYEDSTWAFYDDCFTCFGYYYLTNSPSLTWAKLTDAWSATAQTWDNGIAELGYENVVAGNQQGYVFVLDQTYGQNDPSLTISAITAASPGIFTSTNNNLPDGNWISISGVIGIASTDGVPLNGRNFKLSNPTLDANNFTLTEFTPITGPNATGASYTTFINYKNLIPGSIQVNVAGSEFELLDPGVNGILVGTNGSSGTINYTTGRVDLSFNPPLVGNNSVILRIVSLDPLQGFDSPVNTSGAYTANSGQIAKISNFDIVTKIFNFFPKNERSRLSYIDFYLESTAQGQFTCNVYPDSSNVVANEPLSDNPLSNVVLSQPNPYQIGQGDECIFRLYSDVLAQTYQLEFTMSDYQQAVNAINSSNFELVAMMVNARPGGRLV